MVEQITGASTLATIKELYEKIGTAIDDRYGISDCGHTEFNYRGIDDEMVRIAQELIAEEREACAKVAEACAYQYGEDAGCSVVAAAIRKRNED